MNDCQRWDGFHRAQDERPVFRRKYVYRVKYEEVHGPIPTGTILHHRCGNRWCINVEHLEPMRQSDHLREHGLPGDNHQAAKTHCPQGHEYSPDNTYVWNNERHCKACRRATKARYEARLREKNTPAAPVVGPSTTP